MALPEKLIAEALRLPTAQRAELAHKLLTSLHKEGDEPGEESWSKEIERRAREVLDGEVETIEGELVLARARARLLSRDQ